MRPHSATVCRSGHGDLGAEIDVLNGVEQRDPILARTLERLAPGDEAHAAGALVDHRRGYGVGEVVGAGSAAAVDEPDAAHVAARHLVTAKVDRMVAGQLAVNALVELAVTHTARVQSQVAPVVLRQFLLDDVRLDGDAKVVGLAGEVGGDAVILALLE